MMIVQRTGLKAKGREGSEEVRRSGGAGGRWAAGGGVFFSTLHAGSSQKMATYFNSSGSAIRTAPLRRTNHDQPLGWRCCTRERWTCEDASRD